MNTFKRMTSITLVFFSFAGFSRACAEIQIRPLDNYIKENGGVYHTLEDEGAVTYVGSRCHALFQAIKIPAGKSKSQVARDFENKLDGSINFSYQLAEAYKGNESQDQLEKRMLYTMKQVMPEYLDRMSQFNAATGSMYDEPLVKSDFNTCNNIIKTIMSLAKK